MTHVHSMKCPRKIAKPSLHREISRRNSEAALVISAESESLPSAGHAATLRKSRMVPVVRWYRITQPLESKAVFPVRGRCTSAPQAHPIQVRLPARQAGIGDQHSPAAGRPALGFLGGRGQGMNATPSGNRRIRLYGAGDYSRVVAQDQRVLGLHQSRRVLMFVNGHCHYMPSQREKVRSVIEILLSVTTLQWGER